MATEKKTAAEAKGKKQEKPVPKVEKTAAEAQKHVIKKEEGVKAHAAKAEPAKTHEHANKARPQASAEEKKHAAPHKEHKDHIEEKKAETKTEEPKAAEKEAPAKKQSSEKAKAEKEKKPEKKIKEKKIKPVEKIEFLGEKTLSKDVKELLSKKKGKPRFIRQEYYKLPRLKDVWRKSRGIDSKKHEGKRGKGETPQDGYKNTEQIRGITPQGFFPVVIRNIADLDKIDTKKHAAVIAATVGRRSRNEIIKSANGKKITILNPRNGERGKK
jgi:large subunit ribosomal protein L32e